jgi:chloride channel 3/4/5
MQAPLTISVNSPLELVQQFFVKLGARYVVITDVNGYCELFSLFFLRWTVVKLHHHPRTISLDEGIIDKNNWLAFLGELESKSD